jgi:hypothetical protein
MKSSLLTRASAATLVLGQERLRLLAQAACFVEIGLDAG